MKNHSISQTAEQDCVGLQSQKSLVHRILVVDDDVSLLSLSAQVLSSSGYEVDVAQDGVAAWEALNGDSYDLMITDNNMPRLTGIQLLSKLHATRMALPFIMATGKLPEEEFAQYPWLQPAAILLKPYSVEELLGMVKKVLFEAGSPAYKQFAPELAEDNRMQPAGAFAARTRINPKQPPCRILVVDDDSDVRQLSVDVLAGSGYDVEGAKDGAAGWEALQANNYDLVITDNTMPRMTGIEMIEKLRAARMLLPVIMATGHLPTYEFARKPWLKPNATLQRPFSNDDLLEVVKTVLHQGNDNDGGKAAPIPQHF